MRILFFAISFLLTDFAWSQTSDVNVANVTGTKAIYSTENPSEYWTPERIQEALKNPMAPVLDGQPRIPGSLPREEESRGSPPSGPAYFPTPELPRLPPLKLDTKIACPVTRYEWSHDTNNRQYPQRVVGVLFFEKADGRPFVCSASLVNKKVLLTAGHCVASGPRQWHKNFMWAPGYLNGDFPFGKALAGYVSTLKPWFENENFAYDVAFIILTEAKGDELGWFGLTTGGSPNSRTWRQQGYPAAPPYDGSKLTINTSRFGARDCSVGEPCTMAAGSPLTGGSSGGPWIEVRSDGGYASGLNSYVYRDCKYNMYSPYFGSDVWGLYQDALGRQGVTAPR